jgi:hypothetical protein
MGKNIRHLKKSNCVLMGLKTEDSEEWVELGDQREFPLYRKRTPHGLSH